ncbi:hypothetical protein SFC43_08155 [Bacteroides sp. CR5/BHMF/2]|nr:hypothetical protein [Bacteroides sp. CR5/BHMF/2]
MMGNWLRSKNTIQIVGENLYVHAGLSKAFMEREETIPEINELVSKSIYLSKRNGKNNIRRLPISFIVIVITVRCGIAEWLRLAVSTVR